MRMNRSVLATALAVATLASTTAIGRASSASRERNDARMEVRRIRIHFDSVLSELGARDVRSLARVQQAHRAALLVTLRDYRARGVFPHNYDFPGRAIPYFVDRKTGTLCAVAHLLESTGRRDIVDRVARADNNVLVPQLAGDTAFTGWLDANGITLGEAAFIQMPYSQPVSSAEVARNVGLVAITPFALGGAVATSLMNALGNADGHRTRVSKLGIISGIATAGLGAVVMSNSSVSKQIGASGMVLGLTSIALSTRSMRNHSTVIAAREAERARSVTQTSLAPIISTSNGGSAGLAVSMRF